MRIFVKYFMVFAMVLVIGPFITLHAYAQQKLPLPRMVSLRAEEVNVRTGPGVQYPVSWVFKMKSMPVEIIAEYDTWRKIRDYEGEEGWIHRAMLTGRRSLVVMKTETPMRDEPDEGGTVVARLAQGMVGEIDECNAGWCHVSTRGYDGWVLRSASWGVYPHEVIQ